MAGDEEIGQSGAPRLQLQRMERSLVRARLARPDGISDQSYGLLRYALGLARIEQIRVAGADITVDTSAIAPLREWLLAHLYMPLRPGSDDALRLADCARAAPRVRELTAGARQRLLATHCNDFDAETLDREAGRRAFVSVAGGGGGAGFVYVGAYARLMQDGLAPDYIVGNSIGAVVGLLRAYRRRIDLRQYLDFARPLKRRHVLSAGRQRADLCLPGLLQLHLTALHRYFVTGELRRPLRLDELEIPLDVVVAGVRRRPFEAMPTDMHEPEVGAARMLPFSLRLATRLWKLASYVSPSLVQPLVLGGDADTAALHAVDVVGFSAAVPTVLQYELRGRAGSTREIYAELMQKHELSALIDGGVADNVPARSAWRAVAGGRIGSRNAYYLAFDCFMPKWEPKHLWLWPVAQAIQLQMRANRVYADTMIRFDDSLSPANLVPSLSALEQAFAWGWERMDQAMPEVSEMLRPNVLPPIAATAVAS